MTKIIDCKLLAETIKLQVRKKIVEKSLNPGLAVILVGDDPASHLYVKKKEEAARQVGISFHKYFIDADASEKEILKTLDFLNKDDKVQAILVQLPLPKKFDEDKIIKHINPKKDVDGFHPDNIKLLLKDKPRLIPGLALGVLKLLESTKEELKDKTALIVAKSPVFTEPMTYLLKKITKSVSVINPRDPNIFKQTKTADILITAIGKAELIGGSAVKQGAIVIDIGISKDETGHTCGDINFTEVENKVSHITPVPGGVGPVTVALLLYNTLVLSRQ